MSYYSDLYDSRTQEQKDVVDANNKAMLVYYGKYPQLALFRDADGRFAGAPTFELFLAHGADTYVAAQILESYQGSSDMIVYGQ